MPLKTTIENDLHDAMRAREELKTSTLRVLLASIRNEEVAGDQARQLSDDEVLQVVGREIKKRAESAGIYRDAGRTELADKESAEQVILEGYLPAQLTDEDLDVLIAEVVAETGAREPRDMGKVMKALSPKMAGRADGRRVSDKVKAALAG